MLLSREAAEGKDRRTSGMSLSFWHSARGGKDTDTHTVPLSTSEGGLGTQCSVQDDSWNREAAGADFEAI
eukprot:3075891-Rhodomonas_salina.1